ncbi:MmyB family transcriptional regulator [Frankia tisae]|uniref:MmyB family transcriptional regulator n=1 Tax=Frankia tisae TaxID=2950104 RepID=UPI0021C23D85|nr:hypothetical protein [Frankia tisae]
MTAARPWRCSARSAAGFDCPTTRTPTCSALQPIPAYLLTVAMDAVAWNPAAAALLTDFGAVAPAERNIVWPSFRCPSLRARWLDWEATAADLVATLRGELGRHPNQPDIVRLVTRLSAASAEFADWWGRYDVATQCGMNRQLRHPDAGELHLVCEQMTVPPADQRLVTFHPAGAVTASRLELLADLTATTTDLDEAISERTGARPLRLVR